MENILVSACLLGTCCRYDQKSKCDERILQLMENYSMIFVCPEILGGLKTPRPSSELVGEKVYNIIGEDLTESFFLGAKKTLEIAKSFNIKRAILKSKSPSCGKNLIYDGSFSGKLIQKSGITCTLLMKNNIEVYTEDEIKIFLSEEL